ncbi:hypothetical protein NQ317_004541 [Molorchus minor]|uniref:Sperm microtubule inner protein 1 C-terminal domain-containing protein n=1 Tax=Molorchus minor TaxID=1323400 RepID=A0ABQ9JJD3_9CUCU|nr:hypothetical protein NQ317_004541 [Molorchus minor]
MTQRGLDANLINAFIDSIEKADKLKLKWFRRNEQRLNDIANKPATRTVPEDVKEKFKQDRVDQYTNAIKYPKIHTEDAPPREVSGVLQECSSFEYGWKMWNHSKTMKKTGFGRQQVIKESFYRRRGVERDPDWYREPAGYSPMVCTTS